MKRFQTDLFRTKNMLIRYRNDWECSYDRTIDNIDDLISLLNKCHMTISNYLGNVQGFTDKVTWNKIYQYFDEYLENNVRLVPKTYIYVQKNSIIDKEKEDKLKKQAQKNKVMLKNILETIQRSIILTN